MSELIIVYMSGMLTCLAAVMVGGYIERTSLMSRDKKIDDRKFKRLIERKHLTR